MFSETGPVLEQSFEYMLVSLLYEQAPTNQLLLSILVSQNELWIICSVHFCFTMLSHIETRCWLVCMSAVSDLMRVLMWLKGCTGCACRRWRMWWRRRRWRLLVRADERHPISDHISGRSECFTSATLDIRVTKLHVSSPWRVLS